MKYPNKIQDKNKSISQLLKYFLKSSDKGFTLMEILVAVIIIGVLAAVTLPNLLSCTGRARDSEGTNGVGTLNRSQQAYHFENNTFSPNLTESQLQTENNLGVIIPESEYYNFQVETTPTVAHALAIPKDAEKDGVRGYSGAIFFDEEEKTYQKIMCQTNDVIDIAPKPIFEDGVLSCPENMTDIR